MQIPVRPHKTSLIILFVAEIWLSAAQNFPRKDPIEALRTRIPGEPRRDYPIYATIPVTSFNCSKYQEGTYADVEARCQVIRRCVQVHKRMTTYSFLCPNGTIFDEEINGCTLWINKECQSVLSSRKITENMLPDVSSKHYINDVNRCRIQSLKVSGTCREMCQFHDITFQTCADTCPLMPKLMKEVSFDLKPIFCGTNKWSYGEKYFCCPDAQKENIVETAPIYKQRCFLPQYNLNGICLPINECTAYSRMIEEMNYKFNQYNLQTLTCDNLQGSSLYVMVCCPDTYANYFSGKNVKTELDISKPINVYEGCGGTWYWEEHEDLRKWYYRNVTANTLREEGFEISDEKVIKDRLVDFTMKKGDYRQRFSKMVTVIAPLVGGYKARRDSTLSMALIGFKNKLGIIKWLCDGVLLNTQWVLSAAHCFRSNLNIVRLGEVDLSTTTTRTKDQQDYEIKKFVIHPEYAINANIMYHDLALVQLISPTFLARPDINPVCLPWADESLADLTSKEVTLIGWGATFFNGPSSLFAQEVNITVYDTEICRRSYTTRNDYRRKFPDGMNPEVCLCAGDIEGKKDACQGDSGGPIVYLGKDRRYTLAGIVSTGFGCGKKDFPGIYVPIHQPKYLSWIKRVAFS